MNGTIFVDCLRGLASDMFVGALIDCFDDKDSILRELQVNICNDMTLSAILGESYDRKGIVFKALDNDYNPNHHMHRNLNEVFEIIDGTQFSDGIKNAAKGVYKIIAEAEAEVHCEKIETVHFHEVGSKRAIACVVCACALVDMLAPKEIVFSSINTGFGKVKCAHGEVDVPAPATKAILRGVPNFYDDKLGGELCTPTGAALAKFFADSYIPQSVIIKEEQRSKRVGIGLGSKDIGTANGVRILFDC